MKAFIIGLMMPKYFGIGFLFSIVLKKTESDDARKLSTFFDVEFRHWNGQQITIQPNWQYHRFKAHLLRNGFYSSSSISNEKSTEVVSHDCVAGKRICVSVCVCARRITLMFECASLQIQQNGNQVPIMKIIVYIFLSFSITCYCYHSNIEVQRHHNNNQCFM